MCARRTRRDLHEFVESQYSWLAAFPSYDFLGLLYSLEGATSICIDKRLCLSRKLTFLPLVKDRWTRVVMTLLFCVSIFFAAALADTFLRHSEGRLYGTMAGIMMEKEAENRAV